MSTPTIRQSLDIISGLRETFALYKIGQPDESGTVPAAIVVDANILGALKVIIEKVESLIPSTWPEVAPDSCWREKHIPNGQGAKIQVFGHVNRLSGGSTDIVFSYGSDVASRVYYYCPECDFHQRFEKVEPCHHDRTTWVGYAGKKCLDCGKVWED